jgi:hypothetical protein
VSRTRRRGRPSSSGTACTDSYRVGEYTEAIVPNAQGTVQKPACGKSTPHWCVLCISRSGYRYVTLTVAFRSKRARDPQQMTPAAAYDVTSRALNCNSTRGTPNTRPNASRPHRQSRGRIRQVAFASRTRASWCPALAKQPLSRLCESEEPRVRLPDPPQTAGHYPAPEHLTDWIVRSRCPSPNSLLKN